MNRFCTYVHCRPDGRPFYVGKGLPPRSRQLFRSRSAHHANIVNKYGADNIIVRVVKSGLTEETAFDHERTMIECLRDFDIPIVNLTAGGEGFRGGRHSQEWKRVTAERSRGNKHRVGKKDSDATKALKRSVLLGNKRRLGTRMPEWQKIIKRALMVERNPMRSPEVRAKHRARMSDPEVKEKRSEAMKRAWRRRKSCAS